MLKTRVIPTLLWRDHSLVKGVGFDSSRIVGTIVPAAKLYSMRDVDELILLNVMATDIDQKPNLDMIAQVSQECNVPLTVGGGISSTEDIRNILCSGADKVSIGTALYSNAALLTHSADKFGSQCIVGSIDYRTHKDGRCECFSHCGKKATGIDPLKWAMELERQGAGEIILTSIERDGSRKGYDLHLLKLVTDAVSIPVIASGGAGSYDDIYRAISEGGASAVAAASIFQFTHLTPRGVKDYLHDKGVLVRR